MFYLKWNDFDAFQFLTVGRPQYLTQHQQTAYHPHALFTELKEHKDKILGILN